MIIGESLNVRVYGGDAYSLKSSYKKSSSDNEFKNSKCELGSNSANVDENGSTTVSLIVLLKQCYLTCRYLVIRVELHYFTLTFFICI